MQQLQLQDYSIHIGDDWAVLKKQIQTRQYKQCFVLVDENTRKFCLPILQKALEGIDIPISIIEIKSGERHKSLDSCQFIWQQLMEAQATRYAVLLNLGGGVIGDMGGFCASTFKRGMDFIQIPSTLLSQVDASIGGKLGIDFLQVKNSIGLFRNPQQVFIHPAFLKTLIFEELRSGYAEILKHSLIADATQWQQLSQINELRTFGNWSNLLLPSLRIKQKIVASDPFERGARKALNFGHTIGHAIESWALDTDAPLLHGEAIAIGIICESYLSHQILGLPQKELNDISRYILVLYKKYVFSERNYPDLLAFMRNDKKNTAQRINFTLLDAIGSFKINQFCSDVLIKESLTYYQNLIV